MDFWKGLIYAPGHLDAFPLLRPFSPLKKRNRSCLCDLRMRLSWGLAGGRHRFWGTSFACLPWSSEKLSGKADSERRNLASHPSCSISAGPLGCDNRSVGGHFLNAEPSADHLLTAPARQASQEEAVISHDTHTITGSLATF